MKLKYLVSNKKGMLLFDALLSLLIISMMMQALLISMLHFQRVIEHEKQDYTADFELLVVLLEKEINQYQLKRVNSQQIDLTDGKTNFQVIVQNNKIFKRPGHHPYSYNIKDWFLRQYNKMIEIEVTYDNNQTFVGLIKIEK